MAVEARVQLDEGSEIVRVHKWGIRVAVHADDLGGDALADLGLVERLGQDGQAGMAVQIDEPGGDDPPGGIDGPAGRSDLAARALVGGISAHDLEAPVADPDVTPKARVTAPVHDRPAGDEQIEGFHRVHLRRSGRPGRVSTAC